MKAKICWILLVVAAAGFIAGGFGYVARLASRTRLLEARLARVEASLNAEKTAGARTVTLPTGPASPGHAPAFRTLHGLPSVTQQDSLEARVEKIEQELTPHVELLDLARPDALGVTR